MLATESVREPLGPPEALGPVVLRAGMDCSRPAHALGPHESEQLFNWTYDAAGSIRRRAGSVFFARLGEGVVLGLHEHRFETAARDPVVAAVCARGYATVTTLADAGVDPAAGAEAVFCPEVRHGGRTVAFSALATDRFTFASFYDRLYVAGSSVDPYVRFYDYGRGVFGKILDVEARGCVAYRNRVYYYGDPTSPNLLYPSSQEDAEAINPALALDVGSDNAEILRVLEANDGLFILTTRSAHFYTGFDVEQGDLELYSADPERGGAGRLAACLGPDGFVYWLDAQRGPCRWRRGMEAAEEGFAAPMLAVFERARGPHLAAAVVAADSVNTAVHYYLPTGSSETPNYVVSYFPALGAWVHGATATDLSVVGAKASGSNTLATSVRGILLPAAGAGSPLYTALIEVRDAASGAIRVLCGDESGYVWRQQEGQKDKCRGSVARPGYAFKSFWRSGTWRLGGVGWRAMLHEVLLHLLASDDYSVALRVERDFSGTFAAAATVTRNAVAAELGVDFTLGTSTLASSEELPRHARVPLWRAALGRVLRVEIETEAPVAIHGVDGEFTRSAARGA